MSRVVLYRGRKSQLVALVSRLCQEKRRPVCSLDVREHLAAQSEADFGYIQGLGQILLKAAVPRPAPVPVLYRVGILRNRAYYASTPDPLWNQAFQRFCATNRAEYLIKRGYLTAFRAKNDSLVERAAACILYGMIDTTIRFLDSPALVLRLRTWQESNPNRRSPAPQHERIDRRTTLQILRTEVGDRAPYIPSMNFNRHLARISPPILRGRLLPRYSRELITAYCATQWPVENGNTEQEAISLLHWILVMLPTGK